MENVTEALKMAFGVMVFVIAITLTFSMVSQARQTSDIIFQIEDDSKYFQEGLEGVTYLSAGQTEREVGWDTVVSTIYRYKVEDYGVTIIDDSKSGSNKIIARFDYDTETKVQNWKSNERRYGDDQANPNNTLVNKLNKKVFTKYNELSSLSRSDYYDDVFKRIYNSKSSSTGEINMPWLGVDTNALKERLRVDLQKSEETKTYNDGTKYTGLHLADQYADKKFKEIVYVINKTLENGDNDPDIEIIYEVKY